MSLQKFIKWSFGKSWGEYYWIFNPFNSDIISIKRKK